MPAVDWGTPPGVAGPSQSTGLFQADAGRASALSPATVLPDPASGPTSPLSSASFLSMLDLAPSSSSRSSDMRPSSSW